MIAPCTTTIATIAIPNLYAVVHAKLREGRAEMKVIDITIAGECLREKAIVGLAHQRTPGDVLLLPRLSDSGGYFAFAEWNSRLFALVNTFALALATNKEKDRHTQSL
jgi:type II secretory pathway component PulL